MHNAMVQNSLVVAGFLLLVVADILWVKGKKIASAIRTAGYLSIGAAIGFLAAAPGPWWPLRSLMGSTTAQNATTVGSLISILLVLIALLSGVLLFWSVFFEIGIEKKKMGLGPMDTVRSGTYSLCRHPGFWWFSIFVAAIGLLRGFSSYLLTILLMIALDLLLILIQDRYTFPTMFHGYADYKKSVPFLIPGTKGEHSRGD